jgi:CheY-like chemotaxis protein
VAHDFNNMLGAILGNAELALEALGPSHPARADLLEIQEAARRSADLTRQLLAFARRETVAPKVLDLNEAVGGMVKMLERLVGEGVNLAWRPGDSLWPVRMDPSQIDQVLANLVVNARDAVGDAGSVEVATENASLDAGFCATRTDARPGDYVVLTVRDDGCGMSANTMSHLFEPFFTTKAAGTGTGLGLATVYGVASQNGGFVDVSSEVGGGSEFRVYMPRHEGRSAAPSERAPSDLGHGGGETVLLVEDEPAILRLGAVMLERLGYRVITAATPGEAIRLARENSGEIRLLITDVVMPEMNGRDLARNLLSLYPDMSRLFMSGYTADVIAHHGVLDDGVHFLQKPFSTQDLAAKVREALDAAPA